MKKVTTAVLAILLATLLLASCTPAPASSLPDETSSLPASSLPDSSLPNSGEVVGDPPVQATGRDAEVLEKVNETLAGYADGTYPVDILYHTDAGGVMAWPPRDVSLPASVGMDAVSYETFFSEKYGTDYIIATVELENDYQLKIDISTDGADGQGALTWVGWSGFTDKLGTVAGTNVPATGGSLTEFRYDRVRSYASFSQLTAAGIGPFEGTADWQKGGFLWLYLNVGQYNFMRTYFVAADSTLKMDYPTEEFLDFATAPYTEAELEAAALDIIEQMKAAEADSSWTRTQDG